MIVWSSRHSTAFDFVLVGISPFQNTVASYCVTGNRVGNVQGLGGCVCAWRQDCMGLVIEWQH